MAEPNKCRYCDKEFRKESTLAVHLCEPKRRWQQEKEIGVQLGLNAYLRFYEITQGSAKLKSYEDFIKSAFYSAFVKFGRHIKAINAIAPSKFIEWVVKQNKKLDQWCHDKIYAEYLTQHLRYEPAQDALARAIETAQDWAEQNGSQFNHMFSYGNSNKLCYQITQGRITAWTIYNCDSGMHFLSTLTDEQTAIVFPWIDPSFWKKKFIDYPADVEWAKHMLREAGF
jgi:hypothetical protein